MENDLDYKGMWKALENTIKYDLKRIAKDKEKSVEGTLNYQNIEGQTIEANFILIVMKDLKKDFEKKAIEKKLEDER